MEVVVVESMVDRTPLDIRLHVPSKDVGVLVTLIPRDTVIPVTRSFILTIGDHTLTCVECGLYQGVCDVLEHNRRLGTFILDGFVSGQETSRVNVMLQIDKDGILSVSAEDIRTGRSIRVTATSSAGLSKEDVSNLIEGDKAKHSGMGSTRIADWLCYEFKKQTGVDLRQDRMAMQRLGDAVEKAKEELLTMQQTEVSLPYAAVDASGPKHLKIVLSRSKMDRLLSDQTVPPLELPPPPYSSWG